MTTSPISALCLFCGSRDGSDPAHVALAVAFGQFCADHHITLVYGGGSIGLMGHAARAAKAAGGTVVGVIPQALMRAEIAQAGLDELLVVDTLHARKALMHARADAIVALPGGIGTLDELFEMMTWRELGIHAKPIFLLGNAFWTPFLGLLDHLAASGMAPADLHQLVEPLDGIAALAERVRNA
jgi:uncharacterized protein (TIGR00730 family)